MRTTMVAGNWKMNGSLESVECLLAGIRSGADAVSCEMAVFPPSIYLSLTGRMLASSGVHWGGQNVSSHSSGAFTGEISADMLLGHGCEYVIVGHSERRRLFGENNDQVAAKFHASLISGLKPILCVGETLEQREAGLTLEIVQEQLAVALSLHDNPHALCRAVVAYEPVWAIGTGRTATPEQAQEVHQFIRSQLAEFDAQLANEMRILYGGSVNPGNSSELFRLPDVDGALVGGAYLDAETFLEIGLSCNR